MGQVPSGVGPDVACVNPNLLRLQYDNDAKAMLLKHEIS